MHRFYLPPEQCQAGQVLLDGREAHHALHVLRLQRQQTVTVLDGAGHTLLCETGDAKRHRLHLNVVERRSIPPPPCRMTLFQAVPKGKTMDLIIQKATELGVTRIIPLVTTRSTPHFNSAERQSKQEKWQQIAIEAIKQCGLTWLPNVAAPADFPGQLVEESSELSWIASLYEGAVHPRISFQKFKALHGRPPQSAAVWIGPEGDFTPEELAAAQNAGAQPITLGSLVLRVDTAALYALSVLNYELQSS